MLTRLIRNLARMLGDERGAVSATLVLMLIPLVGILGMATEASSWYLTQRAAQNAADAAVLAASTNACSAAINSCVTSKTPYFDAEAKSVAAEFGFKDGVAETTVVAENNVACPSGAADCYRVTITRLMPIYLTRIVGFAGDATTTGGAKAQTVQGVAIASSKGNAVGYCVTALGTASNAIEFKGGGAGGSLDFGGCNFASNGGASCTPKVGTTANIGISDVLNAGDGKNCGTEREVPAPKTPFSDPYAALASNIPAPSPPCSGSYPQASKQGVVTTPANILTGALTFSISAPKCGDVKLSGDVTVASNSILLINNGRLDLAGFKLSTIGGARLTIIFSGDDSISSTHSVVSTVNGGTLDYSAPDSGTWKGVALYQNPELTSGVDMTYAGNNPDLNISGLIYAPKANLTLSGAIDHATAGDACLAFFANTLSSNGTVSIFANPTRECNRAGLTLPGVPGTESRQALVQ